MPNPLLLFLPPKDGAAGGDDIPRALDIAENVGRGLCLVLMCVNVWRFGFNFASVELFLIWVVLCALLLLGYWAVWLRYIIIRRFGRWMMTLGTTLPCAIFLITGIFCRNAALIAAASLFALCHIAECVIKLRRVGKD